MKLNEVKPAAGAIRKRKRIGRGNASGTGGTAGKGHKGEQARSGASKRKSFEGGQMRMVRRIPKFGFTNHFRKEYHPINVGLLNERFENGDTVTMQSLVEHGLMSRKFDRVKVLGTGELTKKLTVIVDGVSKTAREKIEAAGGTVNIEAMNERQKRARNRAENSADESE
jgi:large subunit ribosomal protein L15